MIDFSGKSKTQIEKEMLGQVPDTLDKREGSIIQTAIGPGAWYLEGLYLDLDKVQKNAYLPSAAGESLDLIVMTRGLTRTPAKQAIRRGTFNIPIPSGTMFKTINGADSLIFVSGYQISDEKVPEGMYCYQLTCTTAGNAGNSYVGQILPITAVSGLASASIGEIIEPGTEEETDDALKTRFWATFDSASFGGNIASYRNAILAIGGVGAVQVYPAWQGGGTVLCSILGTDLKLAIPAVVENVQNIICPPEDNGNAPSPNGYGMAPLGAAVTITTATELIINISCDIQFIATVQNGPETYYQEIEQRIQEYLNEVSADWGNPLKSQIIEYSVEIYLSRIVYSILQIPQVVNVTNVRLNGSASDLVLIETAQLQQIPILGTVTING